MVSMIRLRGYCGLCLVMVSVLTVLCLLCKARPIFASEAAEESYTHDEKRVRACLGLVLPTRDAPANPVNADQVGLPTAYQPLDNNSPYWLPVGSTDTTSTGKLFVAANSYVPLLGWNRVPKDDQFNWNPAGTEVYDKGGLSVGVINLAGATLTTTVTGPVDSVTITVHPVTCSTPFTVAGYQNHTVSFTVAGYTFAEHDSVEFGGGGITIVGNCDINGSTITAKINTAANAAQAMRPVIFHVLDPTDPAHARRRTVTVEDIFKVYHPNDAITSLQVLLNRPAPTAAQPAYPGSKPGVDAAHTGGRRNAQEEARVMAVVDATKGPNVIAPWNALSSTEVSLGARAEPPVTAAQIQFICSAAVQIQGNAVRSTVPVNPPQYPNQPPAVPKTMWAGLLAFVQPREMAQGGVLAVATSPDETSVGMMQFNNDTAFGINSQFGTWPSAATYVDIYRPGILGGAGKTKWKDHLAAATSIPTLKTRIAALSADWRSCPFSSAGNFIRRSEANYGHMIGSRGLPKVEVRKYYQPEEDFRADHGSGRQNGQGSQQDVFAALATAHHMPADVFGGAGVSGGFVTGLTPDRWHTEVEGGFMTLDGHNYATAAEQYYHANAPAGGYE